METSNIYFLNLIPENNEVLITYRAGDVDTISYEDFNTLGLTDSFIELTTEHLEAKEVKQLLELNKEVSILNMYGTDIEQKGNKMETITRRLHTITALGLTVEVRNMHRTIPADMAARELVRTYDVAITQELVDDLTIVSENDIEPTTTPAGIPTPAFI